MMVDAFLAPDTLQGPYADFYRRAIAELLCWRILRDGGDHAAEITEDPLDDVAFNTIGIQCGQA